MNFLLLGLDCGLAPYACLVEISCSVPVNNFGFLLPSFQLEGAVEILLCMDYVMQCPFMGRLWVRGWLILPGAILAEGSSSSASTLSQLCLSVTFDVFSLNTHIQGICNPFGSTFHVPPSCLRPTPTSVISRWITANPHHL